MMLAAVMPPLRPSIWPLSWAAISSQRSARAGDALRAANAITASSTGPVASVADRRNCSLNVILESPFPRLKPAREIQASFHRTARTITAAEGGEQVGWLAAIRDEPFQP